VWDVRYEGEHFRDQRVQLDDNEFEGCHFTNVQFDYAGGPVYISGCRFEGFSWHFSGDLGRGLQMLAQLYASSPAAALTQLSKALFPKPGMMPGTFPCPRDEPDAAPEPEAAADPFDYSRLHASIRRAPKLARTAGYC
jgi:hypothetical protein